MFSPLFCPYNDLNMRFLGLICCHNWQILTLILPHFFLPESNHRFGASWIDSFFNAKKVAKCLHLAGCFPSLPK